MTASRSIVLATSRPDAQTARFTLAGDLTFDSADELLEQLDHQLTARPDTALVVLDCESTGSCDSHGLSVLLMAHRVAASAGVALRLDHLPVRLVRMLQITGTLHHLTAGTLSDRREQT